MIRPVNHLVRDHGAAATFVPFDGGGFVDPDEIARAMRPNTKLVIVNHGSNVIGTVQPVAEIGTTLPRARGDLRRGYGANRRRIPINMREMNIDVVAFTGHKTLMGSMGIGGLCIRKHVEVKQMRAGGTGVRSAYPYHLEEYPWRLEFGTPNMVGIAALWAGQDWLDEHGVDRVHDHEMKLAQKMVEGFRQIEGVQLYCCDRLENHLSTILMNLEGADPGDVGIMLDVDHNIATRTGLHCAPLVHEQLGTAETHGGVRFSIGAFNTEEEVVAAIKAVAQILCVGARARQKARAGSHPPYRHYLKSGVEPRIRRLSKEN